MEFHFYLIQRKVKSMKPIVKGAIAAVFLMALGNVLAGEMTGAPEAVRNFQCSTCHAIEHKIIGPSWMDVSRFYNGKVDKTPTGKTLKEATGGLTPEEWLVTKVSKGGSGNWGKQPMLANDNVYGQQNPAKQAEIRTIIQFVLSLAKDVPAK